MKRAARSKCWKTPTTASSSRKSAIWKGRCCVAWAVNVKLERWSEAVNFHTSALYIARELGDRVTEAAAAAPSGPDS